MFSLEEIKKYYPRSFLNLAELSLKEAEKNFKENKFSFNSYPLAKVKEALKDLLGEENFKVYPVPRKLKGDIALDIFEIKKDKEKIRKEILKLSFVKEVKEVKNFLNIKLSPYFFLEAFSQFDLAEDNFGSFNFGKGKLGILDFSSPNIAKPLGIGHLRSTLLGNSLSNLLEDLSFKVIRVNFLGDWGSQFKKLYLAFKLWGKKDDFSIEVLKNLYTKFHLEAEKDPSLLEKLKQIDEKEFISFWEKVKNLSLKEFLNFYSFLGVKFNLIDGESYHQKLAEFLVNMALDLKIAKIGKEGSVVVENLNSLPTFLLRKGNLETLYLSRDLAALLFRISFFKPDFIWYLVGSEQKLHFKQLFSLAKFFNFVKGVNLEHIDFGLVLTEEGKKMSTRKGTTIETEELFEIIKEKVKDSFYQQGAEEEKVLKLAKGVLVHTFLKFSRNKNVVFEWEKVLSLKGNSAPYLQYTLARINSVLEKEKFSQAAFSQDEIKRAKSLESKLALKIAWLPEVLFLSYTKRDLYPLVSYLEELSQEFNYFYEKAPILKAENPQLKSLRLKLTFMVKKVLEKGFSILGIPLVEKL